MRKPWLTKALAEACEIKPSKSEIRERLSAADLVSFLPMEDLGVGVMHVKPTQTRALGKVAGSYTYFAEGDVLLAKITPCFENGKLGIASSLRNGVGFGSSEYIVFRPDSSITKEWLYYFLARQTFRDEGTARMTGAVGHKRVAKEFVEAYPIPIPPLHEQQRIIGIINEAFARIATAKANAEKNLRNADALFKSYVHSIFTHRGKDWVENPLGHLCNFVRGPFGGSLKKAIFVANGYAVYEQQHAIYDQFDDVRYFVDETKFTEMKRFELLPNDLIMSCSGTLGRVAIVPTGIKRGIINQALLKLTPNEKILTPFLKSWMDSDAFQDALTEYSGGAAIQNVASVKILKKIRIPLPSLNEQGRVVTIVKLLAAETRRLESLYQRKLAALEELKQSLLHQAFTGAL